MTAYYIYVSYLHVLFNIRILLVVLKAGFRPPEFAFGFHSVFFLEFLNTFALLYTIAKINPWTRYKKMINLSEHQMYSYAYLHAPLI